LLFWKPLLLSRFAVWLAARTFGEVALVWLGVNPKILKDNDVLHFQFPAVGKGWELGMVHFVQALMTASMSIDYPSDQDQLQAVLNLPNVRSVDVILGSNEHVITSSRVRGFM